MSVVDVSPLIARLRERREAVQITLVSLKESQQPVELDQTRQGRLSRMDALSQQKMAQASEEHLRTELARIDAALQRHSNGTFGKCCRCRLEIEADRLNADAAVPFCLSCLDEIAEEKEDADPRRGLRR